MFHYSLRASIGSPSDTCKEPPLPSGSPAGKTRVTCHRLSCRGFSLGRSGASPHLEQDMYHRTVCSNPEVDRKALAEVKCVAPLTFIQNNKGILNNESESKQATRYKTPLDLSSTEHDDQWLFSHNRPHGVAGVRRREDAR